LSATVSTRVIFQSSIAESTISRAGSTWSTGAQQFAQGRIGVREIAPQDEGDFAFDLGLDQPGAVDGLAIAVFHVGEQHAEIGLIDAQLLLYRQGCQADLAPAQAPTGQPGRPGGVDLLPRRRRRATTGCRNARKCVGQGLRLDRAQGQRSGGGLKVFVVHGVAPERFWMAHN
jgi:hypothetical protein